MNRVTLRVVLVSGFNLLTCVATEVNDIVLFSVERYSTVWLVCILFGEFCVCSCVCLTVCVHMCVCV